jgi:hypothetical protein
MPGSSSNMYGNKGKFNYAAFAKQRSSHARQGHKISMAILNRGLSVTIFFRVNHHDSTVHKYKYNWLVSGLPLSI